LGFGGFLVIGLGVFGIRRWQRQNNEGKVWKELPFEGESFIRSIGRYDTVSKWEQGKIRKTFLEKLSGFTIPLEGLEPAARYERLRTVREQAMLEMGYDAAAILKNEPKLSDAKAVDIELIPPEGFTAADAVPESVRIDQTVRRLATVDPEFAKTLRSPGEQREVARALIAQGFRPHSTDPENSTRLSGWREVHRTYQSEAARANRPQGGRIESRRDREAPVIEISSYRRTSSR
jgi:hypothetical protein